MVSQGVLSALLVVGITVSQAGTVNYVVPKTPPSSASVLHQAPIGVSFEYFMWPSYMRNITPPLQCLEHFSQIYGRKVPIRIGGTTQDRARYDPNFDGYVNYHVDDPLEAPMDLTYGPKFFDLISEFGAETILGFNRGRDDKANTFAAILEARSRASKNIYAIELGNEPDLYLMFQQPIAVEPWNETQEGKSNADWAQSFINIWPGKLPILFGPSYAVPIPLSPAWPNTNYLINTVYNQTIKDAMKTYSGHLYALSNGTTLEGEMSHVRTSSDVGTFVSQIKSATAAGRDYFLGETGFHGLDEEMDATFGGALVVLDRSLRSASIGIKRLYYHQGTINQAYFNWWSDNRVEAPFYGGYVSALALAGGDKIVAGDDGTTPYAQYVIYAAKKPIKAVLLNTDYYSGNGTRSSITFNLSGLSGLEKAKALRFAAASSDETAAPGNSTTDARLAIGGQYFLNEDCAIAGNRKYEHFDVKGGKVALNVAASEALIVYF